MDNEGFGYRDPYVNPNFHPYGGKLRINPFRPTGLFMAPQMNILIKHLMNFLFF